VDRIACPSLSIRASRETGENTLMRPPAVDPPSNPISSTQNTIMRWMAPDHLVALIGLTRVDTMNATPHNDPLSAAATGIAGVAVPRYCGDVANRSNVSECGGNVR